MSIKSEIQSLLRSYNAHPRKKMGQNFLVDKKDLDAIANETDITPGDTVVEVGAGVGNLTQELITRGARVIAVENDTRLAEIIRAELSKIEVLAHDIRTINEEEFPKSYKLIGNIPYYLTGELLRKFLTSRHRPSLIVLTVQKEVGERIVAKPPRSSFLSMMIHAYGEAEIVRKIPASHFWPQPKIDSVVVRIRIKKEVNEDIERFVGFVKSGFTHPRKTILNNLAGAIVVDKSELETCLRELKIEPKSRPGELSYGDWQKIYRALNL